MSDLNCVPADVDQVEALALNNFGFVTSMRIGGQ
jgi:hypothetical protein